MNDPSIFGTKDQPPLPTEEEEEEIDWKKRAPRWLLVWTIGIGAIVLVAMGSMVLANRDERAKRIEQGITEAQARLIPALTERVAVTEAEVRAVKAEQTRFFSALSILTGEVRENNKTMNELTLQVRLLTLEIKKQGR